MLLPRFLAVLELPLWFELHYVIIVTTWFPIYTIWPLQYGHAINKSYLLHCLTIYGNSYVLLIFIRGNVINWCGLAVATFWEELNEEEKSQEEGVRTCKVGFELYHLISKRTVGIIAKIPLNFFGSYP